MKEPFDPQYKKRITTDEESMAKFLRQLNRNDKVDLIDKLKNMYLAQHQILIKKKLETIDDN